MSRTFKSDLSVKGLRKLAKDLREYKNSIMKTKVSEFVNALADSGIKVARIQADHNQFGAYIGFVKDVKPTKYNYQAKALVIGMNKVPYIARWVNKNGVQEAEVNSLMMAEFGSGQYAIQGYRGTFPNNENRESYGLKDQWGYVPVDSSGVAGELQLTSGEMPTKPMLSAYNVMKFQIESIARRVFST